ncbi:unnamed protein product [Symbiodinium necroappetens]|uniref:Ubiquitin-like domain-containing protein n=1 Tax=Symbiodinium necroappetens TaxID=1628268 RepID=A0A812WA54_9DINO|nr:unnamed protein product [Symbiodinium necroappetens]
MLRVSSSLGEAVTEVPLSDVTDVKSLKRYLTKAGKPPRFQQRLVHQGEILEDGEMISKLEPPAVELVLLPLNEELPIEDRVASAVARGINAMEIDRLLNAPQDPDWRDEAGDTALIRACSEGHVDTVRLLLEARANINAQNKEGTSPLMGASSMGSRMLVTWLLAGGADVNQRNAEGKCASDLASERRGEEYQKIVKQLYREEEKTDREARRPAR